MAIAVAWQTVASVTSTAGTVYTTSAATAATYGSARDLVITNSGTITVFVGLSAANVATTVAAYQIPTGGTLILTQCQIPNSLPVSAVLNGSGTGQVSIGYATNVAYI